ncbi:hypothetical protein [Pseudoalteromonas sp.]|uniref:hypothetical protein n=1 Tax=Pseudoalteromonas sp. TaxID=53249 RepID=UPI003564B169
MGKFRVLLLFVVLIFAFFSSESNANSATCILLKQQMSTYANSKTHPTYRRAQRDYERFCNQPENVENKPVKSTPTNVPVLTDAEKRLAQEQFEALEAQQKLQEQNLGDNTETSSVLEQTEVLEQNQETISEQSESLPQTQPKPSQANHAKNTPIQWQNDIPEQQGSLLEAMMLPIMMLVGVLIAIFIYVKYVRSRMDEIKEKAQEMSKEIVAASVKVAEKKKGKPAKGALDPDLYFRRQRIEVTLPSGQEVMLDSVIASQFGVFVVLAQKQRGAIIGSASLPEWKEQVGDELVSFESPLNVVNQCCHAIGQIIELSTEVEPIVAFNDMAVFKSQFPIAVMHKKKINEYIVGFKELKYSDEQVDVWLEKIDAYIAAKGEQKRLAEEQQRQQNLNRHNEQLTQIPSQAMSPAELGEQEIADNEQETQYPEPGSYIESVSEIVPDSQDIYRIEEPDKPAVDHIAELDAILNKAKEFTEKLDSISSAPSTPANDNAPNEIAKLPENLDSANRTPEFNELNEEQNRVSPQCDEITTSLPEESVSPSFVDEPVSKNENEITPDSFTHLSSIEQESMTDIELGSALNRDDAEDANKLDSYSPETEDPYDVMQVSDASEFENRDLLEENHQANDKIVSNKEFSNFGQNDDTPDNMVPHSEFKRRAAKRAVDDGMFDYLNHYDDNSSPILNEDDTDHSLEEELAQSLAAGKGFLSGLDEAGKNDISEDTLETSKTIDKLGEKSELDKTIENDLTSINQESDLSKFDNSLSESEASDNDPTDTNIGGWRAIKAQVDQLEETTPLDDEQADDVPKSSWRALKEQVDADEPQLLKELEEDDKKEDSTKPSLFSNLELDPDWAPKPAPEKVFKVKPEDDPDNN